MIDPKQIAVQVALRSLQLEGTNQTDLQTAYQTGFFALDGAEVPVLALVDAVVASEARLHHIIGADKLSPYRAELYGRSDNLLSGAEVPALSDEDIPFVGVFSQIVDSEDNLPLTEQPEQVIRRYLRGTYTTEIYNYALGVSRIYHTREAVYFEGCVFDHDAAVARFSTTELSPLPEVLASTWVADTLANLAQEGWFIAEGQYYGRLAEQGLALLTERKAPLVLDSVATAEPMAN